MVAQERINVRETVGRKNNCKLNFFLMYFVQNNQEIHLSFKNSEKQGTQALKRYQIWKILRKDVLQSLRNSEMRFCLYFDFGYGEND